MFTRTWKYFFPDPPEQMELSSDRLDTLKEKFYKEDSTITPKNLNEDIDEFEEEASSIVDNWNLASDSMFKRPNE